MSHTESPDFERAAESHQVLQEARQDRDEIKRLRQDRGDCQMVMDGQQAEIERLRAALTGIAEFCSGDGNTLGAVGRLVSIRNTAERALNQQQAPVTAQCVATHMGGSHCVGRCMMPKDCCGTPLA